MPETLPRQRPSESGQLPSPHFEPHSIEGSLQEMNGAVVGVDDELAVRPLGVFVSADQKLQGELFGGFGGASGTVRYGPK